MKCIISINRQRGHELYELLCIRMEAEESIVKEMVSSLVALYPDDEMSIRRLVEEEKWEVWDYR